MVSQLSKSNEAAEIFYPDSDDQPMASNTEQYRWIVIIQQNLNWLLPDAFVAGDLFWYPIEGRADISVAPDVMVALGRPKGKRPSYKQWQEENVAPQVIFEILSPSNTKREMEQKLLFFERHGVKEYYLYDTESHLCSGFLRGEFGLAHISEMAGWESPLLKIRFDTTGDELQLIRPDGTPFLSYEEVIAQAELFKQEAESAKQEAESAKQRADKLAEKLRSLGVNPDDL
ncbi:Uma2 family endonuclease [cf. Phormidesmis sp. LEGE 11477]|uniref:Uma2 family endonuclease n=1 Tax=cf. Phormidesmis sp. LEGE 11477 TaxID=1828680 RepID=UPI00187FB7A0|nr:Uma2 family endonuclease [cf. Phormidesmis sp. LEGE 11477]MBE9061330.1 Uma2 family endonuclease [cf. Phormidesmis sp. LEGE 11477]